MHAEAALTAGAAQQHPWKGDRGNVAHRDRNLPGSKAQSSTSHLELSPKL
jgi:hypothetical protein